MIEIIFRGRDKAGGWLVGSLLKQQDKYSIIDSNECGWNICGREVDPETVGQYTGLKDKNGKMIFEGDRVGVERMDGTKSQLVVTYEEGSFLMKDSDNCWLHLRDAFRFCSPEIIGNIHEGEK